VPEAAGSPVEDDSASAKSLHRPAGESRRRLGGGLVRIELELPDGRYLLSYHQLEEVGPADA
jgi:hypothetical protein